MITTIYNEDRYYGKRPLAGNLSDAELAHHGIKGQHWGIRRYQNKDGSLTAAGKKRYEDEDSDDKDDGSDDGSDKKDSNNNAKSTTERTIKTILSKKASEITEDEMRDANAYYNARKKFIYNFSGKAEQDEADAKARQAELEYYKTQAAYDRLSKRRPEQLTNDQMAAVVNRKNAMDAYEKATAPKDKSQDAANAARKAASLTSDLRNLNNAATASKTNDKAYKDGLKRMGDLNKMSNDDLVAATQRLQLENSYRNAALNGAQQTSGKDKINSILAVAGSALAVGATAIELASVMKKLR